MLSSLRAKCWYKIQTLPTTTTKKSLIKQLGYDTLWSQQHGTEVRKGTVKFKKMPASTCEQKVIKNLHMIEKTEVNSKHHVDDTKDDGQSHLERVEEVQLVLGELPHL